MQPLFDNSRQNNNWLRNYALFKFHSDTAAIWKGHRWTENDIIMCKSKKYHNVMSCVGAAMLDKGHHSVDKITILYRSSLPSPLFCTDRVLTGCTVTSLCARARARVCVCVCVCETSLFKNMRFSLLQIHSDCLPSPFVWLSFKPVFDRHWCTQGRSLLTLIAFARGAA